MWDLHPLDVSLWARLVVVAFTTARRHKLPLTDIAPTPTPGPYNKRSQNVNGCCFTRAGVIHIVLRFRNPETGEWMPGARPEAAVWRTLAHELAHLEEERHSERFYVLLETLLADINSQRRY